MRRTLLAMSLSLLTLAIPRASLAQSTSEPRFTIGGSLVGAFGQHSALMPSVRASFQLTTRAGLDIDMGTSTRSKDPGLAPRGFMSAFAVRIGSRPDAQGSRKYLIVGSRTLHEEYPDHAGLSDTIAAPFLGFGIDRRQPHIRAAGEFGVTGGFGGTTLLLGFCVQWAAR